MSYEPDPCDCELRNRKWNGYGRCLMCGGRYVAPHSHAIEGSPPIATPPMDLEGQNRRHAVQMQVLRCTKIADEVVPEYRGSESSYSCTGSVAKRWQAAWDGACIALGGDPKNYRGTPAPAAEGAAEVNIALHAASRGS